MKQREAFLFVLSPIRSSFEVLALLAVIAVCSLAQTAGSGAITGAITDPAGAVVPGAPGNYEVSASKPGFSTGSWRATVLRHRRPTRARAGQRTWRARSNG